jgi:hypothetical protein
MSFPQIVLPALLHGFMPESEENLKCHAVAELVEVLRHELEGCEFGSR